MKKFLKGLLFGSIILAAVAFTCVYEIFGVTPFNLLKENFVNVDGYDRNFKYHVPEGVTAHPKLIFVLHGSTGTPLVMQVSTGHIFDKLADQSKDAIIVYPAGFHKFWNDCRKMGTYDPKRMHIDDVAFFGKMIQFFKQRYDIDTTQVFAVGYSNGGQMCYKLAKEKPEWFRGIAAISANLPVDENNDCYDAHKPISVLVMNGTADPISPYNGGEVIAGDGQKRGAVISTEATIRYWVDLDSCSTTPADSNVYSNKVVDDNSFAAYSLYKSKDAKKQVELIKIFNGGHLIPNPGFNVWPKTVGNVNKDINGPEIIWNFFKTL